MSAGLPRHVAVIPDGNRRWAAARGLRPEDGHRRGFLEVSPALLERGYDHGLHTQTLWLFSTDNWRRSEAEVQNLMVIFCEFLALMRPIARRLGVRMRHLGRADRIPAVLADLAADVQRDTAEGEQGVFNFALDYGGRDELVRVARRLLRDATREEDVDERLLDRLLGAGEQPYPAPDLIVRTAGDRRLSGFAPWHAVHSELCFVDKRYPDMTWEDVAGALAWFGRQERRFGR